MKRAGWLIVGVCTLAASAHAQDAPSDPVNPPPAPITPPPETPPQKAPKDMAQELLDEGLRLVDDAEFAAALTHFERAYALFPSPKLLLNIGSTLRYLGRNANAIRTFERYLASGQPQRRAEVAHLIEELADGTAWLAVDNPARALDLRVDGEPLPVSAGAVRWRVDPGRHVVSAKHAGGAPLLETVTVAAGDELTIRLRFERVTGEPRIVLVAVERSPLPWVGLAVGGVGLAGIGIGAIFGVLANDTDDEAATHCQAPSQCDPVGATLGSTAEDQALASTLAFCIGGAATAAGIVLILASPEEEHVRIEPTLGGLRARWMW